MAPLRQPLAEAGGELSVKAAVATANNVEAKIALIGHV